MKYSSIAQKYSQLKAVKQGRLIDRKEVYWKKLVLLKYQKYGDRFESDQETKKYAVFRAHKGIYELLVIQFEMISLLAVF